MHLTALSKGSVESLVKWVKGNFLAGRIFRDDDDLAEQEQSWLHHVNSRPSSATGEPPSLRLLREAAQGGVLPPTAADYGLAEVAQVSAEALVAVSGNRYSVPVAHVGAPVTVRLHRTRVRIWRDQLCLADHPRAPDGAHRRVIDPTHYAPLFPAKPRAQAMLYRDVLLELGGVAVPFVTELSRGQRSQLAAELRAVYALYEQYGASALLQAMTSVLQQQPPSASALAERLAQPSLSVGGAARLMLSGVPSQAEVDRQLSDYEAWVEVDEALSEVISCVRD